jgi:hypothetical protein
MYLEVIMGIEGYVCLAMESDGSQYRCALEEGCNYTLFTVLDTFDLI